MFNKKVVPKKKPIESFQEIAMDEAIDLPEVQDEGELLCECGEPVAPGQDQVCAKHIRTN